ncbi:MAG: peptidoglycan DD-metalloendopeptidase family protein [Clostridia bacterium]|nr:peptidoglycan DD-metalloendopeptidase family protein [Clostridia bacterium]
MKFLKSVKNFIFSDFTVLIIPNTRKTTKQFKLNAFSTYTLIIAFLVLNVFVSISSVVYYNKSKASDSEITYLSSERVTNLSTISSLKEENNLLVDEKGNLLSENEDVLDYLNQRIAEVNDLYIEMSNVIATFNEENNSNISVPVTRSLDRTSIQAISTYRNVDAENTEMDLEEMKEQDDLTQVVYNMKTESASLIDEIENQLEYLDRLPDLLPVEGKISSGFGYRRHPITGLRSFHYGIDITANRGDPVEAAGSGVVVFSGWSGTYGKVVIISHGFHYETVYAHNNTLLVEVGDVVSKGQVISKVGTTGSSTGPHLHFEIRYDGEAINPTGVLRFDN